MKSVRSEENTGFPGVKEDTGSSRRQPSRAPYTLFFVQFVSHPVTETSTNLYVKKSYNIRLKKKGAHHTPPSLGTNSVL